MSAPSLLFSGRRKSRRYTLLGVYTAHPDSRPASVDALVLQLGAHLVQEPEFNALLISALLDIPAPESAPAVGPAFANGRVDESVAGDWEDVQIKFGLMRRRAIPPKANRWTSMGAPLRESFGLPDPAASSDFGAASAEPIDVLPTPFRAPPKVGRNDPCPCGSGKKVQEVLWCLAAAPGPHFARCFALGRRT